MNHAPWTAALALALAACGGGEVEPAGSPLLLATRAQAEHIDRTLPGRSLWVDVECCDALSVDFAVASAQVQQITLGLDNEAPVFVTGPDARLSTEAALQLAALGMKRVHVVAD
ncbi:hypothetical protein [uncultured Piscinibacter sp.]|uniref:hypothetical protein n=1 Tax=uncultured Piscinibacter sp. TaxID=1131835 RepID=UPI00260A7829|nr:hypothetical protein [uncultured Piscinibacter sp.]